MRRGRGGDARAKFALKPLRITYGISGVFLRDVWIRNPEFELGPGTPTAGQLFPPQRLSLALLPKMSFSFAIRVQEMQT